MDGVYDVNGQHTSSNFFVDIHGFTELCTRFLQEVGQTGLPGLPLAIQAGIDSYRYKHRPVGGFLTAVLENDLCGSLMRADPDSRAALLEIVQHLHNEMPGDAWGSKEKVKAWLAHGGEDGEQTS